MDANSIVVVCVLVSIGSAVAAPPATARNAVNVQNLGAVPDGQTDCAPAIQKALDTVGKAGGGRVLIPAADKPYLVCKTIRIAYPNVELVGKGAALLRGDNTVKSSKDHVLWVYGSTVKDVVVRGLTVDANYWNQQAVVEQVRRGKKVSVRHKPRGVIVGSGQNVLLDRVHVRRAWVSLAFSGRLVGGEARDCTVTQWHNDGFDAAGPARDIRFVRCKAFNAKNEANGGLPGGRDSAWEIEDGVQDVTLTDCVVEDTAAIAYKVRSHKGGAKVNRNIRFIRCATRSHFGLGWLIRGDDHDTRTENVRVEDCTGRSVLRCDRGAQDVAIQGGRFGVVDLVCPTSVHVSGTRANQLNVWAVETEDGKGKFRPAIILEDVATREPPVICGDKAMVTVRGKLQHDAAGGKFWGENFWDKARFEERAAATSKVLHYFHARKRKAWLWGDGANEGSVTWEVRRAQAINKCLFTYNSYVPFQDGRAFVFSVSVDDGKTWRDVHRRQPKSDAGSERWGGGTADVTDVVTGRKGFLLRATLVNGGGRLFGIRVLTEPE